MSAASAAGNIASGPPPAAAEQRAYDAALDQFKRGDYQGAITGFTAFVKTYPRSPLASSAQYWIGNAHFARKDYKAAIASQRQLLLAWPEETRPQHRSVWARGSRAWPARSSRSTPRSSPTWD